MKLKDIMTKDVCVVSPETPVREVALRMRQQDVGAIPVCVGRQLEGMITDRDLVLNVVAEGKDADQCFARDVMTSPVIWCFEDSEVSEAGRLMESHQLRRLAVVDREKNLVGIVALGDLATRVLDQIAAPALEKISEPTHAVH